MISMRIPLSTPITRSLCAAVLLAASAGAALAGPFDLFAGNWSGTGTIYVNDGQERIRCRATYSVDAAGTALTQVLLCASDSYRFNLSTNVTNSGGALSGSWGETSRGVSGTLEGRMSGSDVRALVSTVGFTANLTLTMRGGKQTISIRSDNQDLRGVDISLAKS
jgi:hypothetical protein